LFTDFHLDAYVAVLRWLIVTDRGPLPAKDRHQEDHRMSEPANPVGTEKDACTGSVAHTPPRVPQFAYVEALSDPAPGALPERSSFRLIAIGGDVLTGHVTVADLLWEGPSSGVALSTYELVSVTEDKGPPNDEPRVSAPHAALR
jgi:hypothetical protein